MSSLNAIPDEVLREILMLTEMRFMFAAKELPIC